MATKRDDQGKAPFLFALIFKAAKKGLPAPLVSTLNAYATWANAEEDFANCYAGAEAVGRRCGRSKYVIHRDQRDLEHFGLLELSPSWKKGTPKSYRVAVEKLEAFTWTRAHQVDYERRRRAQQHKPRMEQHERVRQLSEQLESVKVQIEESWNENAKLRALLAAHGVIVPMDGSNDALSQHSVSGYAHDESAGTIMPTSTVPAHQSSDPDPSSDPRSTVDERGPAVENAGAPKAASVAESPAAEPRLTDAELLAIEGPSKKRHNEALGVSRSVAALAGLVDGRGIMRPVDDQVDESSPDAGASETLAENGISNPPVSGRFRHLSHVGHRFLAEEGRGGVAWSDLRHRLRRSCTEVLSVPPDEIDPLVEKVMRSLESQRAHWLLHHPPDNERRQEAR